MRKMADDAEVYQDCIVVMPEISVVKNAGASTQWFFYHTAQLKHCSNELAML